MWWLWLIVANLVALLVVYAVWGRSWLKRQPWAQGFFAWVEPIELVLFRKSETILFARLKMLTGLILAGLTMVGTIDLTPLLPFVPEQHKWIATLLPTLLPLVISMMGGIDEWLRNKTTKPIELVAVSEAKMSTQTAQVVEMAEAAKAQAIASVEQAKG